MIIQQKNDVVTVSVYVQPRAARTEIVGEHNGALKLRVAAPPVDGAANEELIGFFAKLAQVPARNVRIRSGAASRTKVVEVTDITADQLRIAIEQAIKK